MLTEGFKLTGGPAPVLEHLTRRFNEVLNGMGTMETCILCPADEVVNTMTKFLKRDFS